MSHTVLAQSFARLNKCRYIWVSDNGNLIKGSPFSSNVTNASSIGLSLNSSIIKRYLYTDKLYLNRYAFYSRCL